MAEINGWTFAADVSKTVRDILSENPALPFSEAKVEDSARPGGKRRGMAPYGMAGRPVLTGEIKLPGRPFRRNHNTHSQTEMEIQKSKDE